MNSYNDNLHAAVVGSLSSQELNIKTVQSQTNAAMFTLFHAEAATITTKETLDGDTEILNKKKAVNDQAVLNTNVSTNLVASATQADAYAKQSVTNTSVCASNVQIAANAIVQLAGDMGSIYSIVHAADYQSDIYGLTEEARTLINDTAYLAEVTSDMAMQASITTSEVASGTVLMKAKLSNTSLNNLFATTTSDFNNAAALVTTDTVNVGTTSVAEQAAEGVFEDMGMDYRSSWAAYHATQKQLNHNLRVLNIPENKIIAPLNHDSSRNVRFNLVRAPFPKYVNTSTSASGSASPAAPIAPSKQDWSFYPVKEYYFIVAKDSKKSAFTIGNAETIIRDNKERAIRVPDTLIELIENMMKDLMGKTPKTGKSPAKSGKSDEEVSLSDGGCIYRIHPRSIDVDIDFMQANSGNLRDSDGDAIKFGTAYVVFLMATYEEAYKKEINNFDEYLSAPTYKFTLTQQVPKVQPISIKIANGSEQVMPKITFSLAQMPNTPIEYRCMFLPYGTDVPTGMLNKLSIEALLKEVEEVETIANKFDPKIAQLELQISLLTAQTIAAGGNADAKLEAELVTKQKELADLITERDTAMSNAVVTNLISTSPADPTKKSINFLFSLALAEQITDGCYLSYMAPPLPARTSNTVPTHTFTVEPETTDIFGNLLKLNGSKKQDYLVTILSIYNGEEQNLSSFSNAWSGYEEAPVFPAPADTKPTQKK